MWILINVSGLIVSLSLVWCLIFLFQPVLVFMSKVDGRFSFSPISVNFLTEIAKVLFAIAMLIFQVLLSFQIIRMSNTNCFFFFYIIKATSRKKKTVSFFYWTVWLIQKGKKPYEIIEMGSYWAWTLSVRLCLVRYGRHLMMFQHNNFINAYDIGENSQGPPLLHFNYIYSDFW